MACSPPARYSDHIQSDPLYRKTLRSIHPMEAAGIISAQSYGGRRGHTTRYVIVNEHDPRKKLLRSATRIPRHFLMEEPAEILELYPRNIKRYAPAALTTNHTLTAHTHHSSISVKRRKRRRMGKEKEAYRWGRLIGPDPSLTCTSLHTSTSGTAGRDTGLKTAEEDMECMKRMKRRMVRKK
ncbi:hypothetical protein KUCAC02_001741 [Chaenocephalus aceratus]|uniref:Uncharacterized protein n=1 Tax=Chaenocephalus aceratus TaxID=36190 RepID=A0ACB9XSW9_CHAAC|nr:hypothetical protein KUCAC02_001741 [Chaenocephalus aceratus]